MNITGNSTLVAFAVVGALGIAACGGGDADSSDTDACEAARNVNDALAIAGDAETETEIKEAIDRFADALDDLAEASSDDIRADAELLAQGTRAVADMESGVEPTQEQRELLENEEYTAAGDRLDRYFEATCGLEL